jgi:FixJ family two-component response regulator
MMPSFSGAQFRARQLATPEICEVPVVVVSAVSDLQSRAQSMQAFAVLQKPVDPDQLTEVVRRASLEYLARREGKSHA